MERELIPLKVMVDPELKRALSERAALRRPCSVASIAREAIRAYLAEDAGFARRSGQPEVPPQAPATEGSAR